MLDLIEKNKEMLKNNLYNSTDTRQMLKIDSLTNINDYDLYLIACCLCNYDIEEKSEARDLRMEYFLKTNNGNISGYEHSISDYKNTAKTNITCKNTGNINKYGLYEFEINTVDKEIINILWSKKSDDCLKYVDSKTYSDKIIVSINKGQFDNFTNMLDELLIKYDIDNLSIGLIFNNNSNNTLLDTSTLDLPFELYPYQLEDAQKIVKKKRALLGHEMGCISGNCLVTIKENDIIKDIKLSELYNLYTVNNNISIKSYVDETFKFMPIKNVLYKGEQSVIKIQTIRTFIICTLDHEILTNHGWVEAQNLKINDIIISDNINNETTFIDTVVNIDLLSMKESVFDVVIDSFFIHNFVANNIVVHNCGKTLISILVGESIGTKQNIVYNTLDNLNYNDIVITDKGPLPIGKIVEENIDCKVQVTKNGITKFVNILDRNCTEE